MDRLKLIEVIAAELRIIAPWMDDGEFGRWAGRIADRIIVSGALRSLRTGEEPEDDPEGGTMPPGPWTGSA